VVFAKGSPSAGQRIFIYLSRGLRISESSDIDSKVARREKGLWVVLSKDAASASPRIIIDFSCSSVFSE
jgi:hypothetical protein